MTDLFCERCPHDRPAVHKLEGEWVCQECWDDRADYETRGDEKAAEPDYD